METLNKCEALVTLGTWYESIKFYLDKNQANYSWVVAKHDSEDGCHGVMKPHHHWVIWWEEGVFSNTALVSFLKRKARKERNDGETQNGRFYNHEAVRKLRSILMYMNNGGRSILWGESNYCEEVKKMFDEIPERAIDDMAKYVEKRDDRTRSVEADLGVKVNLQSVIDMVIGDGCSSFDEWQREVFRLHRQHDAPQRQALIRVLGHPRGDALIRNCESYMKSHVMSMDWMESLRHRKPLLELDEKDGKYYGVKESKNWIRRICRHNNWSVTKFVTDVKEVMMREKQKINCIFLQGPSNAGKSTIATSIRDGFLSVGQVTRSDTFLFQDCTDRQLIFQEECIIKPETCDDWKRMMEGAAMKVDIKNKDPKLIVRTPVLVCSNQVPWYWVQNECSALKNRMKFYRMRVMEELREKRKDLNPLLWLSFLEDLGMDSSDGESVASGEKSPVINRKRSRPTTPEEWLNDDIDGIIAGLAEPVAKSPKLGGSPKVGGALPNTDPLTKYDLEMFFNEWQTQPCSSTEIAQFEYDQGRAYSGDKEERSEDNTINTPDFSRFIVDQDTLDVFNL
jgi:hypothetical protein